MAIKMTSKLMKRHHKMVDIGVNWVRKHGKNITGSVLNVGSKRDKYIKKHFFPKAVRYRNLDIIEYPEVDIIADIQNMPQIPSNSEDCIVAIWMIYQVPDVTSALKELKRVLKSNGVLLITFAGPGHRMGSKHAHSEGFSKLNVENLIKPYFKIDELMEYIDEGLLVCTFIKAQPII